MYEGRWLMYDGCGMSGFNFFVGGVLKIHKNEAIIVLEFARLK
jgi:hypothetical protein